MDIERLYGRMISLAESETESDILKAKFIICDFGVNGNGVRLNRDTIDSWVGTLVSKPLVGKVVTTMRGEKDFSSHCMKYVKYVDKDGNQYNDVEFDTSAFGAFTDCAVENIDGKDYIVAECTVWKRYKQSCDVLLRRFESGTLHTSWEIQVLDETKEVSGGKIEKVINDGVFIGHCALGETVAPAYDSSKLLEVASNDDLASALANDSYEIFAASSDIDSARKEDSIDLKKEDIVISDDAPVETPAEEPVEEVVSEEAPSEEVSEKVAPEEATHEEALDGTPGGEPISEVEPEVEQSALTVNDISDLLWRACDREFDGYIAYWFPNECLVWVHPYAAAELEMIEVSYSFDTENNVVLGEPKPFALSFSVSEINERASKFNDADKQIEELNSEIAELTKYRDIYEKAAKANKVDEIKAFAKDSGCFTDDELAGDDMKAIFDDVDYSKLNGMIADRLVAKKRKCGSEKEEAVDTSDNHIVASLVDENDKDYLGTMENWLRSQRNYR